MIQPIVSLNEVSKSYNNAGFKDVFYFLRRKTDFDGAFALHDITFDVFKGEKIALVGRNGSGKTTLLRLIAGTLLPEKGIVEVNSKILPIIYLGRYFNPDLTVLQNIKIITLQLGFLPRKPQEIEEIRDFSDLSE